MSAHAGESTLGGGGGGGTVFSWPQPQPTPRGYEREKVPFLAVTKLASGCPSPDPLALVGLDVEGEEKVPFELLRHRALAVDGSIVGPSPICMWRR
jgi:hypothetical protein